MASSRHKGTNEFISTYGNATRDFTSLATWEAVWDIDLVTSTISPVLECYYDAYDFIDYVTMNGAITNSSYFRIIRPASGQGHDGTPNNGVSFICFVDVNIFLINEAYSQIQDIIAQLSINSVNARVCFGSTAIGNGAFIGDIAVNSANAGSGVAHGFGLGNVGNMKFVNCIAIKNESAGFTTSNVSGGNTYFYNCSSVSNSGFGFVNRLTANICYFENCLSTNNSLDFANLFAGTMNVNYCASFDATANNWGGIGNRINQTFTFVDTVASNYHLASTDTGARNYGTDLSADATYAFDDDINNGALGAGKAGETRPWEGVWDIGFDEYICTSDRWHPSIEQPYIQKNEIVGY